MGSLLRAACPLCVRSTQHLAPNHDIPKEQRPPPPPNPQRPPTHRITIICGGLTKSLTGTGIFFTMYSQTTSTLYLSCAEMGTTGAPSGGWGGWGWG